MNIELKQREIKFRVWDIEKKCFIPNDVFGIITCDFGSFGVMIKDWEDYREGEYFYDKFQIPSQCTGLKDKNGNEIYEWDICKTPSSNGTKEQMAYGCIVFHKGSFHFHRNGTNIRIAIDMLVFYYSNCEIIGNIFENPELLNKTT